ncbi:MAG: polyribonucleotide nucleotidyltransferase [Candidatus Kerfeldbacteria bacterium]|nr:polyribonucleotide nucleotidyltransferase [Candidatus Kerfeldbacteria bacterium]
MTEKFTLELGGRTLTIETGQYAAQANGSVTVRYGDTVVLATAVMSANVRDGIDYFPLLVDYEERLYAAGKIKGSRFIKREGRPSDEAFLTARLVDRSVRPLFNDAARNDVQVVLTVLSVDQENDPDIIALIAASAALAVSNIPWKGPIGAVRVGRINDEWVLNPTYAAREKSSVDLVLAGTKDEHVMIEASANEVDEETILGALEFAQKWVKKTIELIEEVVAKVGQKKAEFDSMKATAEETEARLKVEEKVKEFVSGKLRDVLTTKDKSARQEKLDVLKEKIDEALKADNDVSKEQRPLGLKTLEALLDDEARQLVLEENIRVDGRKLDEIRPLSAAAGMLPRTHGSGLFQRGETQVLSIVTLGSPGDEQMLDTMELSGKKRYMHHYNFPGFSTGEVKPIRTPGRREIGHGALAEKALMPVLPPKEQFPYTIRVVSEVLSSNGSTSQASICGSSLALMDAGVPITAPVAGIAMGLITDLKTKKFKVLTDIQGIEDHSGDMDYKVAGTRKGITVIQLDIKLGSIPYKVSVEALAGSKKARLQILDVMAAALPEPRKELSPYAPRIESLQIDPEKIREVIGRGGETINKIIDECGGPDVTKIDIEDSGLVMVTSHSKEMSDKAIAWIKNLTREIEPGEIIEGTVAKIVTDRMSGKEIGAVVDLGGGRDGMVHISELSVNHVPSVSDVVKIGDVVKVKVVEVDKERGRISLSIKQLDSSYDPANDDRRQDRGPRNGGFGGGRGFRDDRRGPRRGGFRDDRRGPRRDDRGPYNRGNNRGPRRDVGPTIDPLAPMDDLGLNK